jgi:hypothetical protein
MAHIGQSRAGWIAARANSRFWKEKGPAGGGRAFILIDLTVRL